MAEDEDQGVPGSATPATPAPGGHGGPAFAFDAVVLAGGRSSRLGGRDKPLLERDGRSLLLRTVDALRRAGAHRIVAVRSPVPGLGADIVFARESPPFAGPAAAAAAGLDALDRPGTLPSHTLVVASDLPAVDHAVSALLAAATDDLPEGGRADGWVGADEDGRRQHLLLLVRTGSLRRAIAENGGAGGLIDRSMRRLLAGLDLVEVVLPGEAVSDIDTPEAAARFGYGDPVTHAPTPVAVPPGGPPEEPVGPPVRPPV